MPASSATPATSRHPAATADELFTKAKTELEELPGVGPVTAGPPQDVKTALQEWAQGRGKPLPIYEVLGQTGPDHSPKFEVKVHVEGHDAVIAEGNSKRAAEKAAASTMLRRVGAQINE